MLHGFSQLQQQFLVVPGHFGSHISVKPKGLTLPVLVLIMAVLKMPPVIPSIKRI